MTDKMPAYAFIGEGISFLEQLLHVILPDIEQSGLNCFADEIGRKGFCYCNQANFFRFSSAVGSAAL